jgi:hypothetical protein
MRLTDSSMATLASADSKRRAWSRSSDAIVWRLFFTRWWISRIVASFESEQTVAPPQVGDVPQEHEHAHHPVGLELRIACTSSEVSLRSTSSVTGSRARMATSTASWSKPISARRNPDV